MLVLVDELTGVVVEHADAEHSLVLDLTDHPGRGLTVSLADGSAVRAAVAEILEDARMLRTLLTVFTRRWDHEPYRDGYRLWFELDPALVVPAGATGPDDPDLDLDVEVEHHLRLQTESVARDALPPAARAALDVALARNSGSWPSR